jgi:hypothetical protein
MSKTEINPRTGECSLTRMSRTPDKAPNPEGSWGIGSYCTEREGHADGYGFARTENPNWFYPDHECCETWEIENHRAACELYNSKQSAGE